MFSNSVGVTRLIALIITKIIFWMSQDNYFPNIDTNIFKDSHVRFLDWLSNSISTSYANDTNHIVHINKTREVLIMWYMMLFHAQVGEIFIVCKVQHIRIWFIGLS